MAERPIDLGRQRLLISRELGSEFASFLEDGSSEGGSGAVGRTREYLAENPTGQIIGAKLKKNGSLSDFEASLCRQMGLPRGSKLKDVKNRLAGRENDFLLVILGKDNLSSRDRKKLRSQIKKLGLSNVVE